MSNSAPRLPCYLVEWYRDEVWQGESAARTFAELSQGAELMSEDGASAKVLMTLSVPTDDVIFCVFAASSAEVVAAACARVGLPAERVTAAVTIASA